MSSLPIRLLAAAALALALAGAHAAPIHKCVRKGAVSYQQDPCPSEQARQDPSLEELNAAEKKRRAEKAATAALAPRKPISPNPATASAPATPAPPAPTAPGTAAPEVPRAAPSFRCDGRQHCSQMSSCEEAKFFLANCPNTKMDGDRDGIPCEEQWCAGPVDQVSGRKRR
jgi:hypothetical protein